MDYSKFLEDTFDYKQWINAALKSKESDQEHDQHISNLIMKLQVYMQEVNTIIEDNCQQAMQSVPRVLRELDSVRQEASLLQDSMRAVRTEIEAVERETSRSMSALVVMETVKTRMTRTEQALREADSWTTLSENVDEVLASGDTQAITEKICGLQQSLTMLTAVGDYTARVRKVEDLKNHLETLVSPRAVQAFASHNQNEAAEYVNLLTQIGRREQAVRYYEAWLHSRIGQLWREALGDKSHPPDILDEFYRLLSQLWSDEIKASVFDNPLSILCQSFGDCLESLTQPPVDAFIGESIKESGDRIKMSDCLLQRTDWFATSIRKSIEIHNPALMNTKSCEKLAAAIYYPFKGLPIVYAEEEKTRLLAELQKIKLDDFDVAETLDLLLGSVRPLMELGSHAIQRCHATTHSTAFPQLLECLKTLFNSYLAEFRRVVVNLREKCVSNSDSSDMLSKGLQLTIVVGELHLQFDAFVQELLRLLVEWLRPSSGTSQELTTPFNRYPDLLLDTADARRSHKHLAEMVLDGVSPPVLVDVRNAIRQLSEFVHKTIFSLVFQPVKDHLDRLPKQEEVWESSTSNDGVLAEELPSFGYSPQENITKIGQFFMTLPQQLAAYLTDDNAALSCAISSGKIPFFTEGHMRARGGEVWLECLAQATMHHLVEAILLIRVLSPHGNKQLLTDLDYLISVLDDLDLAASEALLQIRELLAAPAERFEEVAAEVPRRIASHVRLARGIAELCARAN